MADELTIRDNVPNQYVVVKGDTLWGIAEMFLADPWKWVDIWYSNPQVENPHLIFPGDVIGLVSIDGELRLTTIVRGEASNTLKINTDQADENGVVKLRPMARITPIFGAIPAIPREHVEGFLSGNRVLASEELKSAPYVISGMEGRLLLGAGDSIYARGEFDANLPAYQIYRMGKRYQDPVTKELLGYEAIELGTARLSDLQGDIATFTLERTTQQVAVRDRILPSDEAMLQTFFYPSEPPAGIDGVIIDSGRGVTFIGQYDVVLINVGDREAITPGMIFRVNRRGDRVRDPVNNERLQLPEENSGLLMVFRTFDKMSYALVLDSTLPMRVGDPIVNPGF
ncbi:LysM peptidoglycan-binding domain-containing protein [Reinekea sp.]|uniref:LysM peptidoglycan-binding domain-containing protein n=1 Tax=Reinekea sp. TaxID=1970455 RepID=UPI002A8248B4|nr:LysM peptidoglycan-binding domain-containing protein [Reinekea sp.]